MNNDTQLQDTPIPIPPSPSSTLRYTSDNLGLTKGTLESAGFDLPSSEELTLYPNQPPTLVGTGLKVSIPKGHVGLVFSRSGMALNGVMVANGVGVIDEDYRGELKVMLRFLSSSSLAKREIKPGDRIAQLVIVKLPDIRPVLVESLDETERGEGGFGSTGV